jgi:hypothetical protein
MRALSWFFLIGTVAGVAYFIARWRRQWEDRRRASEARFASFIAQAKPAVAAMPATAAPAAPLPAREERLLLDAAGKAGEAGEPVLSIQLYAKLLSRYPATPFAAQARAAVAEQKKKLAKT